MHCALAIAALLNASPAHPSLSLAYRAPDACPTEAQFHAVLAARLGFDPLTPDAALAAAVTLSLSPSASAYDGQLTLRDSSGAIVGERTLSAADCAALAESLALALAIAIDPQRWAAPPPVVALPSLGPSAQPPAASTPATTLTLAAGPRFGFELLPAPSGGVVIALDVRRGPYSLWLELDASLASAYATSGGRVDTSVFRAGLAACGHLGPAALCLRTNVGFLRAEGQGFAGATRTTLPVWSVGPLLRAEWHPASSFVLGASGAAGIALVRPGLTLGPAEVWHASALSVEAGVFGGWQLP